MFRTEKRRNPQTGQSYPWIVRSTAMVNHYYFYGVDEDFGPFFLKFCSYFPYNGRLYLNGHEYAKRQMSRKKIPYEALDNGVQSCGDLKNSNVSAMVFRRKRSTRSAASGFVCCPTRFRRRIEKQATAMLCRFSKPSFP